MDVVAVSSTVSPSDHPAYTAVDPEAVTLSRSSGSTLSLYGGFLPRTSSCSSFTNFCLTIYVVALEFCASSNACYPLPKIVPAMKPIYTA